MHSHHIFLKTSAMGVILPLLPSCTINTKPKFRYSLYLSTIRNQHLNIAEMIEIVAQTGYGGIEIWASSRKDFIEKATSSEFLFRRIKVSGIKIEYVKSFIIMIVADNPLCIKVIAQLIREMKLPAKLTCTGLTSPPAGAAIVFIC